MGDRRVLETFGGRETSAEGLGGWYCTLVGCSDRG